MTTIEHLMWLLQKLQELWARGGWLANKLAEQIMRRLIIIDRRALECIEFSTHRDALEKCLKGETPIPITASVSTAEAVILVLFL